jgi:hypothetical protein
MNSQAGSSTHFLLSRNLQKLVGVKYCHKSKVADLLLGHGLLTPISTIGAHVETLNGDSFGIRINAINPSVLEAKHEICRIVGAQEGTQTIYQGPNVLTDETIVEDGSTLQLVVEKKPDGFQQCNLSLIVLGEAEGHPTREDPKMNSPISTLSRAVQIATTDGPHTFAEQGRAFTIAMPVPCLHDWSVARCCNCGTFSGEPVTSANEMSSGVFYWEMELRCEPCDLKIGICDSPFVWAQGQQPKLRMFMNMSHGGLGSRGFGPDDLDYDNPVGPFQKGDFVGMLLDLDKESPQYGSLRFFKNVPLYGFDGAEHGVGFPPGTIQRPCVAAVWINSWNRGGVAYHQAPEGLVLPPPLGS